MPNIPPTLKLKRAIVLSEKIQSLETELAEILGLSPESVAKTRALPGLAAASFLKNSDFDEAEEAPAPRRRGRPPGKKSTKSASKPKSVRHFSAEAREKIAAAQRKRWAKAAKTKKRK